MSPLVSKTIPEVIDPTVICQEHLTTLAVTGIVVVGGINVLGRWFRRTVLVPKLTISDDVPRLGQDRKGGKLRGQAVVCGGSVAGLLTAAVLSSHYHEVLIVEPEGWVGTEAGITLPEDREARLTDEGYSAEANKRTRVMQTTSVHIFLAAILPALRQLFPNFQVEADALGLSDSISVSDIDWRVSGVPCLPRPSWQKRPETMWFTRTAFETFVRRLVRKSRPNIRWYTGTVTGVNRINGSDTLESVVIRTPQGSETTESAALVVDATGPARGGLKWLERLGLPLPPSMRVQYSPKMFYVTMVFTIPPHLQEHIPLPGGWKSHMQPEKCHWIYVFMNDPKVETTCVSIGLLNHSQITVYVGGWDMVDRPTSPAEVKSYMDALVGIEPVPKYVYDLMDVLQSHMDKLNPTITKSQFTLSTYIHYHNFSKTPNFPSNFVAIGDSVMTINPVYGQGCTKATIGAVTLDHVLRRTNPSRDKNFASTFFQKQCDRVGGVWDLNKDSDYGFASTTPTEGETHATGAFSRWFGKQLITAAFTDPVLSWTIWDVRAFLLPPTDLFAPSVLAKVLWVWLTGKSRSAPKAHAL